MLIFSVISPPNLRGGWGGFLRFRKRSNIGGNKIRLIAAIHYNRQKIYIRAVLTHSEYNKNQWKE